MAYANCCLEIFSEIMSDARETAKVSGNLF